MFHEMCEHPRFPEVRGFHCAGRMQAYVEAGGGVCQKCGGNLPFSLRSRISVQVLEWVRELVRDLVQDHIRDDTLRSRCGGELS